MAVKVFLDANILLDFFLKRAHYEEAKLLIQYTLNGNIQAYISPSIIHISGYWLTKAYGHDKTKRLLLELLEDIKCIEITPSEVLLALRSDVDDIEDAMQYYTALHHKLDCLISRDEKFAKAARASLPVYTPGIFIEKHSWLL